MRESIHDGADFYRNNLDAIMASNHALIRGFQAISAETLAFLQSRMKATLEVSQRLAACRQVDEAVEAQIEYMRSSVQAYADEFKRMTEVGGQLFDESVSPLASRAEEVEKRVSRAA
ncbi:MAG: phasin family protein [Geminicoccaceae bacterium]|nr:phasin family protein [Geminicoccaceae bacterium]